MWRSALHSGGTNVWPRTSPDWCPDKNATYTLAVVIEVEVDTDGLVRTLSVEYSLIAEINASERLDYKGITKKKKKQ